MVHGKDSRRGFSFARNKKSGVVHLIRSLLGYKAWCGVWTGGLTNNDRYEWVKHRPKEGEICKKCLWEVERMGITLDNGD